MDRNVITIEIIPEDFRAAPEGFQNGHNDEGCVLHQALKRMFPDEKITVRSFIAIVGEKNYAIPDEWGTFDPADPLSPGNITNLSRAAKESLEGIPTVSLTLTPY